MQKLTKTNAIAAAIIAATTMISGCKSPFVGHTGPTGAAGLHGATGLSGLPGLQGEQGPQGPAGVDATLQPPTPPRVSAAEVVSTIPVLNSGAMLSLSAYIPADDCHVDAVRTAYPTFCARVDKERQALDLIESREVYLGRDDVKTYISDPKPRAVLLGEQLSNYGYALSNDSGVSITYNAAPILTTYVQMSGMSWDSLTDDEVLSVLSQDLPGLKFDWAAITAAVTTTGLEQMQVQAPSIQSQAQFNVDMGWQPDLASAYAALGTSQGVVDDLVNLASYDQLLADNPDVFTLKLQRQGSSNVVTVTDVDGLIAELQRLQVAEGW